MKETISIFWFRRDLRLHDNAAFYVALKNIAPVLPIFIFDTEILGKLPEADPRVTFIWESLQKMKKELREKAGSDIALFHGDPVEIFKKLSDDYTIKAVFTNNDYEPYARKRDKAIKQLLNAENVPFFIYKDQVIFEKDEVVKDDGTPYVVYTPYSKKWLKKLDNTEIITYTTQSLFHHLIKNTQLPGITLAEMGFTAADIHVPDYHVDADRIASYEATRNFPGLDYTSKLGPHLRFGTVSIREMVKKARKHENNTFLKELIWREFFMQILWHFPHTATRSFKPAYDRIEWRNNEAEFEKWCKGETGYPLVDAGMRQLQQTGFMHNRVRMLTGSFLCKHLLIDWRWGEAWFAEKLLDYEMASNVGNWQWVAGCGVDAAPYFRIFNPITQGEKFDPMGEYTRCYVPELKTVPDRYLFKPWEAPDDVLNKAGVIIGRDYPEPIVDVKQSRLRALEAFQSL